MPWKNTTIQETAKNLGVDLCEVEQKQRLIAKIVNARKERDLSQQALAKKLGVTQSRIAQIESGVGSSKVTFDVLLHILCVLGYEFKIVMKKAA